MTTTTPDITAIESLTIRAAASIEATEGKRPTVSITGYTGGLMEPPGWGLLAIDLSGLTYAKSVPILVDHDMSIDGVAGQGKVTIRNGALHIDGQLASSPAAQKIIGLARDGFPLSASVGVSPTKTEFIAPNTAVKVNGRTLSDPRGFVLLRAGHLFEMSILPVGADKETEVTITARGAAHEARKQTMTTEPTGTENTRTIEATRGDDDHRQEWRQRERARVDQINRFCGGHDWNKENRARVSVLQARAIEGEISESHLCAELMQMMRAERPQVGPPVPGYVRGGLNSAETIEAALLSRLGKGKLGEKTLGERAMECGDRLRATCMLDICRSALNIEGRDAPHERKELVRAAFSTQILPTALGNTAHKIMLEAYEEAPSTWRSFATVRSAANFKPTSAIRPSLNGRLEQVTPGGELKHSYLTEFAKEFKIDTFGKILRVDRRDIINDDLGIFDDVVRAFGRMSMRSLNDLVYEVLLANAGSHFSTGNANYMAGADTALAFASLDSAIGKMAQQRDADGNDLDLRPAVLLVPPELRTTATALIESEFISQITDSLPTGNSLRRALKIEVEPRLSNAVKFGDAASTKAWYVFAGPESSALVVAFLEGKQTPTLEHMGLQADVDTLSLSWRAHFDFGAALIDPAAAVKSLGEAE